MREIFLVEISDCVPVKKWGVRTFHVRKDGRILDEERKKTEWRVVNETTLASDNDPHVAGIDPGNIPMEDRNKTWEFFSWNRGTAKAWLKEQRAAYTRRRKISTLFREHGLNNKAIERKRKRIIENHGLDDKAVWRKRDQLKREHGLS